MESDLSVFAVLFSFFIDIVGLVLGVHDLLTTVESKIAADYVAEGYGKEEEACSFKAKEL